MSILNPSNYTDMSMWAKYPLVFQIILDSPVVDHYEAMLEIMWGPYAYVKYGPNGPARDALYKVKQKAYEKEKKKLMADLKAFFPGMCRQWGCMVDAVMNLNHNDHKKVQKWRAEWTRNNAHIVADRTFGQPIIADDDNAEEIWGHDEIKQLEEDVANPW